MVSARRARRGSGTLGCLVWLAAFAAIKAAPAGTFAGLEVYETETTTKDGQVTVNRRWKVPPTSPGEAHATLAKVLALGHVNDPGQLVVNQTLVVQALNALPASTLRLPDGREVTFPIESFSRYCLLNGIDELGYLLSQMDAIERFERTREAT